MCSHAVQGPFTRFMLMQTTIYQTRFSTMCSQVRQRYIIHAFLELSNNFVVDVTNKLHVQNDQAFINYMFNHHLCQHSLS